MKIIFLGTSGSFPTKERNPASIAIRRQGEVLLFDCGEGTQRQMAQTEISPMQVGTIFLTHFHGDHFLGVPGLIQTMSLLDREKNLDIFGPPGTEEKISKLLEIPIFGLKFDVRIQDIYPGETVRRNGYEIRTAEVDHSAPGIAYALVEDQRPGKFYPEKAKELGIEPGPMYSRLQQGEEILLSNGTIVKPSQVMGPPRSGRKIVYSGDTRPSDEIVKLAEGADLLIHDGTFSSDLEDEADEAGHSTVKEAAEVAKKSGVEKLVLTHVSPRYSDLMELEKEAKEIFSNSVFAEDFSEFEVGLKD